MFKDYKEYKSKHTGCVDIMAERCLSYEQYSQAIEKIKDTKLYDYLLKKQKTPYNTLCFNTYFPTLILKFLWAVRLRSLSLPLLV